MNPRLRNALIIGGGIALAIVCAVQIANESYGVAAVIALFLLWIFAENLGGPRPEAWLLAFVLFGYIVGNRGFAQISVSTRYPLLFAETALAVCLPALVLRSALRRSALFRRDALNLSLLVWIVIGTARLPIDLKEFGVMAARDYATIYYALFFFVAQALAAHEASSLILRRALQIAMLILPATFLLSNVLSEAVFNIQIRGIPVIFYKEDLVAAALFSGFFLVLARPLAERLAAWRWVAAAACFGSAFAIGSSRAGIAGMIVTLGWWTLGRRWRPLKLQAVLVPVALVVLAAIALVRHQDFRQSRIYVLYEHLASMVDVTGTRSYSTEDRQYVGDNNRFRVAWWRAVAEEALEVNPAFGVGFGYDITSRFVRTYEFDLGDDFSTRSPHSILMTVFGRMGIVGLAAWLAVMISAGLQTWRLMRLGLQGVNISVPLGWWSVSWVYLTSACFGVVLEGPMGAVIFWTCLGLANGSTTALPAPPASATQAPEESSTDGHATPAVTSTAAAVVAPKP